MATGILDIVKKGDVVIHGLDPKISQKLLKREETRRIIFFL